MSSPSRRRRGLLLSVGVLIGLPLLLEGGARLILGDSFSPDVVTEIPLQGCVEFDLELGWSNPPNFRARTVIPSIDLPLFESEITINSRGMRDREHALEKRDGVLRIAVLGDSFTWGWGVDDGECWSDLLERRFGPDVEFLNFGVPGFSTDQQLLQFERDAVHFEPDLVLLCFILNDVEGNEADFLNGFGKPRYVRDAEGNWSFENLPVTNTPEEARKSGTSLARKLKSKLALARLLARKPERVARPAQFQSDLSPEQLRSELRSTPWPFPLPEKVPGLLEHLNRPDSATHALLERLQRSAEEIGAPLVAFSIAPHDPFLFIPGLPEPAEVVEAEREGRDYETKLSRELTRAGERIGFRTFSVDHAMLRAVRSGDNLNNGDGHLTDVGNIIVAGSLARSLQPILDELRKEKGL